METKGVALVTGGSRGIGAGVCLALARAGFDIAYTYVTASGATADEVKALGRQAVAIHGDVTSAADRATVVAETVKQFGRLDVLVNNAGVAPKVRADLLDADEESYDRVMTTNLKGPYFLTQLVAREMIAWRRAGDAGFKCIVNVSSVSAYTASVNRGDYCLSKAGIGMATALWAARLAEFDIPVYEIRPGVIATDMTAGVKAKYDTLIAEGLTPIRRWGQPADVGQAVVVCASGQLPFSTGEVINVDGGFHLRTL